MSGEDDLTVQLEALREERERLQQRILELEDALQSCLSRARY